MKRRIVYMALTALVLIGGGTLGWYYLANQVHARVNRQVERLAGQGKTLECDNQRVEGYPFRVGLFCDHISYEDKSGKVSFKAGELRSAAQFYQPGFVVGELDGPAELQAPGLVDLKLDWKLARSSSRLSVDGLKRVSLKLEDIRVTGANGVLKELPIADLSLLELHLRPGGNDTGSPDIEAAIDGEGVRFGNTLKEMLPPLTIKIDGVISELNRVIKSGQDVGKWIRSNGLKLQVHKLEIGIKSGGSLMASGPLQVGRDGLVNGALEVAVTDIQAIVDNFTAQNPQLGETAKTIQTASMIITQGAKDGKVRMKIQIRRGAMTVGFLPLGFIPRLF